MIEFVLLCFIAGIVIAIPVWIVSQRLGTRRGLHAARHFNPDDAVPCEIEPVALKGRLMPDLETARSEAGDGEEGAPR
jgi:hypothetical protein